MNKIVLKYFTLLLFICFNFFSISSIFAQTSIIEQDGKFEQLLKEKRKINSSINVNDRFKIQIFKGGDEDSKKALIDFKKANPKYDITIVFNTPEYKVWVGNYKSRIEATRNLELLKKTYPNALLIKPSN